jgi:uncharacterized protein with NRDE domain
MCLVVFAYKAHPKYKLLFAANRDEFYNRPSSQAQFWAEYPFLLAGKDLQAGGTWLGITQDGRFAAITNYRDMKNIKETSVSRGFLPLNFLTGKEGIENYYKKIKNSLSNYNGFNLIAGDIDNLHYFSNVSNELIKIKNGVHGLSNAMLDTPWPKVNKSKGELFKLVRNDKIQTNELLNLLSDTFPARDEELPDTGIGLNWERALSSILIRSDNYGTRSSTVILVDNENNVQFTERTFSDSDPTFTDKAINFKLL